MNIFEDTCVFYPVDFALSVYFAPIINMFTTLETWEERVATGLVKNYDLTTHTPAITAIIIGNPPINYEIYNDCAHEIPENKIIIRNRNDVGKLTQICFMPTVEYQNFPNIIATDGSVELWQTDKKYTRYGWGFYIKLQSGVEYSYSGSIKVLNGVISSNLCETLGAIHAVLQYKKFEKESKKQKAIIYCDNLCVVRIGSTTLSCLNSDYKPSVTASKVLKKMLGPNFCACWFKGHISKSKINSFDKFKNAIQQKNQLCDTLAAKTAKNKDLTISANKSIIYEIFCNYDKNNILF